MDNTPDVWMSEVNTHKYFAQFLSEDKPYNWVVCIPAPTSGPYCGIETWWQLVFPANFPKVAPAVMAQAGFPHPNLGGDGENQRLCTAAIQSGWKSGYGVNKVLAAIEAALASPDWGHNLSKLENAAALATAVASWKQKI